MLTSWHDNLGLSCDLWPLCVAQTLHQDTRVRLSNYDIGHIPLSSFQHEFWNLTGCKTVSNAHFGFYNMTLMFNTLQNRGRNVIIFKTILKNWKKETRGRPLYIFLLFSLSLVSSDGGDRITSQCQHCLLPSIKWHQPKNQSTKTFIYGKGYLLVIHIWPSSYNVKIRAVTDIQAKYFK